MSMFELPAITIVTPSFNQAEYIEETIDSVLSQGYPRLEYIIIDGGSTDGSADIIRRYEKHLAYWVSEKDGGQSEALNKGLGRGTGALQGYINSDDVYCPGTLRRVASDYLKQGGPAKFWQAYSVEDFNDGGSTRIFEPDGSRNSIDQWCRLDCGASLHQPGVFWSTELWKAVGGFDATMRYAFDRKFFMALLLHGARYATSPEFVAARFRLHGLSKTCGETSQFLPELEACRRWALHQLPPSGRWQVWRHEREWRAGQARQFIQAFAENRPGYSKAWVLAAVKMYPPTVCTPGFWLGLGRRMAHSSGG